MTTKSSKKRTTNSAVPFTPWTCPKCGRRLTVKNQEHVCGIYDLGSHFTNKDPLGRTAYNWMCDIFDALGPYDLLPMKTTIAFAEGVNLAFLKTKRTGAEISIVLPPETTSPRFTNKTPYSRTKAIFRIPIATESDLNDEIREWLKAAYELGIN